jgi:sporulation integral membrane protein YlbJ
MIIPFVLVMFNIFLLIFPSQVLQAARGGLLLWFHTVLPTLLPFMVGVAVIMQSAVPRLAARVLGPVVRVLFGLPGVAGFGLVAGLMGGYPIGAKIAGEMCREDTITPPQALRLAVISNTAGPLFIVGAVGVGMFGSARIGYLLRATNVAAAIITGIILRRRLVSEVKIEKTAPQSRITFGDAVKNSMEALVLVGGTIIFFSVVAAVMDVVGVTFLSGLAEMTGGIQRLANAGGRFSLSGAAFLLAFGGAAIQMQSLHFLKGSVKPAAYFGAKLLHGGIAAGLVLLF